MESTSRSGERTPGALRISPSVSALWGSLQKQRRLIDAQEIVRRMLELHPEYGGQQGEGAIATKWPELEKRSVARWKEDIYDVLDPRMVNVVHGRLLVRTLCHVDPTFGRVLGSTSFLQTLESELHEDFYTQLKPEHAGAEAYRGEFIRLLNNKAKSKQGFGDARTSGFVVYADGGPSLASVEGLCFRQSWNPDPLTAHYVVPVHDGFGGLITAFLKDLLTIAANQENLLGSLRPEFKPGDTGWGSLGLGRLSSDSSIHELLRKQAPPPELLAAVTRIFRDESTLQKGQRIVLLGELRGTGTDIGAEELGIGSEISRQLEELPERMGIVLSGLPAGLRDPFTGPSFRRFVLPRDPELTRGQALLNDTPGGPDRLKLGPEVNALAEAIALEEMRPPLVVGVLGGWGTGKSFVLHMIEQRIQEIRCEAIPEPASEGGVPDFPFVGHPYVIRFDAWAYAKSNLWASLIHRVFSELDRQISLEQLLASRLEIDPRDGDRLWRLLYPLSQAEVDVALAGVVKDKETKASRLLKDFAAGKISSRRLWEKLEGFRLDEREQLKAEEGELQKRLGQREAKHQELRESIAAQAAKEAEKRAWDPAWREMLKVLGVPDAETVPNFDSIRERITPANKILAGSKDHPAAFVAFTVAGLLGAVLSRHAGGGASLLSAVSGFAVACAHAWNRANRWLEDRHRRFEEHTRRNLEDLAQWQESALKQVMHGAAANGADEPETAAPPTAAPFSIIDPASLKLAKELRDLDDRIDASRAQVEGYRRRVGVTAHHADVLGLIRKRLESGYYDDRLGLMHQVQCDLLELSDALLLSKGDKDIFPRGTPRVVLLIDDLDRCPPKRVVEVLEAAQLLVKTRLFVVVLAMDVRYVTRALEREYAGVLQRWGEPSGLDYIEKIIQIPYRVRPVSRSRVSSYLRGQMDVLEEKTEAGDPHAHGGGHPAGEGRDGRGPAGGAAGGRGSAARQDEGEGPGRVAPATPDRMELRVLPIRVQRFSRDELDAISQCCGELEISPRSMKRLANVFKLIKILWFREGQGEGPEIETKQAMLALLALAARFPEPLRQLLGDLEQAFRDQKDLDVGLAEVLKRRCAERARTAIFGPEWDQVSKVVGKERFLSSALTLSGLQEANLHIVSSFSFVGETDLQREAALRRNAQPTPADRLGTAGTDGA